MKYCFIINPVAGQKKVFARQISLIETAFQKNGLPYEIAVTERPGHAAELTRRFAAENPRVRVLAMGGDGTLSEAASGAVGCDHVEIGAYPSGSGNDFIKYFGSRADFLNVEYMIGAEPVAVDLVKVNDRYCINMFCAGIDASVAGDIPKYRRLPLVGGAMAYNLSLAVNFMKKLGNRLTLTVNGHSRTFRCLLLAAANGRVYGGGYCAAPDAVLDDGFLEVVTVDTIPRMRMAAVIPVYKKGKHIQNGAVVPELRDIMTYERTDAISVSADREIAVNLDGETHMMKDIEISVLRRGLKFLVPPKILSGMGK